MSDLKPVLPKSSIIIRCVVELTTWECELAFVTPHSDEGTEYDSDDLDGESNTEAVGIRVSSSGTG